MVLFTSAPLVGMFVSSLLLSTVTFARPAPFAPAIFLPGAKRDVPLPSNNIGLIPSGSGNLYRTNITLGGLQLTVRLDTSTSDLVVNLQGRQLDIKNTTNDHAKAVYVDGEADGVIAFADLQLGEFTISSQAFLNVTDITGLDNFEDGILGVANDLSVIEEALSESSLGEAAGERLGKPPMQALFSQRTDLSPNFDVQLSRFSEVGDVTPGIFLIGDHDTKFQEVLNATQLTLNQNAHGGGVWSAAMDNMNVNGQPFFFNQTILVDQASDKVAAAFSTDSPFSMLPPPAVDAIYSTIPGAMKKTQDDLVWFIPCNATTNVSFVFAGQEFFVHPLDLSTPVITQVPATNGTMQNATVCVNTYQASSQMPNQFAGFSLVLGDAFLRNVYISFNLASSSDAPFVQMISTTPDLSSALAEFQGQRAATLSQLPPALDPSAVINVQQMNTTGKPDQAPSAGSSTTTDSTFPVQATSAQDQSDGPSMPSNGAAKPVSYLSGLWSGAALLPLMLLM
ncbi:hypothetical protein BN946_scf184783.g7 [Trametes cinnabarina]|uniref:Peptidase A1 domain-containing protein n=1 Tax=Pycnoporus cinnabarinus TaxID=5643 RepID=A0A060SCK7_PYCCI|nr:hypothetical protein BN946_scf184783.g7 [Trametes cinnabarina]